MTGRILAGQVVLVTGGGMGIGRAIALEMARRGADVAVADLNLEAAQVVSEEVKALGCRSLALPVDVRNKVEVQQVVHDTLAALGAVDILCSNAGVSTMKRVVDLTEDEWDFNMDVNAKGVFLTNQAVLPHMIDRRKGKIINTASMAGKRSAPLLAHYSASKWGVIGFTKALAAEVGQYGITCNCVCPGFVKTSMQDREIQWEAHLRGMTPSQVFEGYVRQTPLGRIESPEDVARVFAFLASPDADFITGEAVDVTGGADI